MLPSGRRPKPINLIYFHRGVPDTQTHSKSEWVSESNWESLLEETTDDDASAIDDVSQILDDLQEEQEQEEQFTNNNRMPMIPDISNIKRHIPVIPAPTIMIPTSTNSSTKFVMPKIPMVTISYAVPVPVMSSVSKVEFTTTSLTRKQRVKRWQAKRHRRNWGKKNTKNEYYGLRKDTAAKRRRTGGKFSGSNVSWVSCS